MLEEIAKRGKKEWELFDLYRSQAFQPTQEEIEAQEKQQLENMILRTQWYLALYGIEFTGKEKDFDELYKLYIKWDWSRNNEAMNDLIWDDDELERVMNDKIEYNNNLKEFCLYVLSYE